MLRNILFLDTCFISYSKLAASRSISGGIHQHQELATNCSHNVCLPHAELFGSLEPFSSSPSPFPPPFPSPSSSSTATSSSFVGFLGCRKNLCRHFMKMRHCSSVAHKLMKIYLCPKIWSKQRRTMNEERARNRVASNVFQCIRHTVFYISTCKHTYTHAFITYIDHSKILLSCAVGTTTVATTDATTTAAQ